MSASMDLLRMGAVAASAPVLLRAIHDGRLLVSATNTRSSSAYRVNEAGVLVQDGPGVTRQDHWLYDAGGVRRRTVLVEGQRQNVIRPSESRAVDLPTRGGVTDGPAVAGLARSIAYPTNPLSTVYAYHDGASLLGSTEYVFSVFLEFDEDLVPKAGSNTDPSMHLSLSANGGIVPQERISFQRIDGRLWRAWTALITASTPNSRVGVLRYAVQIQKALRVAGYQVEPGTTPSSYIPTAGSAATRDPDALTLALPAGGLYGRWIDPATGATADALTAHPGGPYTAPSSRAYTYLMSVRDGVTLAHARLLAGVTP